MQRDGKQTQVERVVKAESVGALIPALLRHASSWKVVQAYRHCLYCVDRHGNLLCLGDEQIDRGPYTINCLGIAPLLGRKLHGYCHSAAGRLVWPGVVLDTGPARIWSAKLAVAPLAKALLAKTLCALAEEAANQAPSEGYGAMIPEILAMAPWPRKIDSSIFHCHLRQVLATLSEEAGDELKPETLAAKLTPLIGIGHGLTPSGDDFCAGTVIGLAGMGRIDTAVRLAQALHRNAREKTTVISLAGYRALADSLLSESLASLLACFGGNDLDRSIAAVRRVAKIGGTSGWDTLAGFVYGLAIAAPAACRQRRVRVVESC